MRCGGRVMGAQVAYDCGVHHKEWWCKFPCSMRTLSRRILVWLHVGAGFGDSEPACASLANPTTDILLSGLHVSPL